MSQQFFRIALSLGLAAMPAIALAHPGHGEHSMIAGLTHPILGFDHLAAMVALGIFANIQGHSKLWLWPVMFVGAMVMGFGLGSSGIELPLVEPVILASVIVLGLFMATAGNLGLVPGALLVALFGLAHGAAHGVEAPAAALGGFFGGMVVATVALHLVGIGLGKWVVQAPQLARIGGVALAVFGVGLALA